jgi:hydrogenase expression/formation protein HypE
MNSAGSRQNLRSEEARMTEQRTGKITAEIFDQVILRRLGARDPAVLAGPAHGVDAGVVRVAPDTVMALTSDPVFIVPAYGWERAAWFAVHILASDAATSGLPPRWMTVDLNLPPAVTGEELAELWDAYSRACEDLGIAVVAGHTARYDGCNWPMVGGATCIALGPETGFVTPAMARPGDRVVVTKGAAIEAAALFAATYPDRLAAAVGTGVVRAADALFGQMTVVPECRVAARFGLREEGVTSMHDATEGGVLAGLAEVAAASGTGLRIDLEAIPVRPEVRAVCGHVGIDPYASISEGTLIATVAAGRAGAFVAALAADGIEAAVVGEVVEPSLGTVLITPQGEQSLRHPGVDPFWQAFSQWANENEPPLSQLSHPGSARGTGSWARAVK